MMREHNPAVYRTEQIRWCEQTAIQQDHLSADALMERAGKAAWQIISKAYPHAHHWAIFCGAGNNAGDGYVLARIAHQQGRAVTVYQCKSVESLPEPARHAALQAIAAGVVCQLYEDQLESETDLIIDALLGIGLTGDVREPYVTAINYINESGFPIVAIDIPSGLDSDTGRIAGVAIQADMTITFIGKKLGQLTSDGPDCCGHLLLDTLQLDDILRVIEPAVQTIAFQAIEALLPPRRRNCHKAEFGNVLIVGGNLGMPGAIGIAAASALRVGAGMVTVATHPYYAQQSLSGLPEAMVYGIEKADLLRPLLEKATVCLVGPGLGEDAWAQDIFHAVLGAHLPTILDASALRLLSENPQWDDNWILTPHPGEAADLLHISTQELQQDRYHAVCKLQEQYGGTVVLKGLGSLIATDQSEVYICTAGNPGMASPGMGDALSGILAGLLAQGLSLAETARLGVFIHAYAADLAVEESGERGLLAQDLNYFVRKLINNYVSTADR